MPPKNDRQGVQGRDATVSWHLPLRRDAGFLFSFFFSSLFFLFTLAHLDHARRCGCSQKLVNRLSKQLTSGSFEGLAAGAPSDASPKAKTAEEVLDRPSEPEISLKRLSSR